MRFLRLTLRLQRELRQNTIYQKLGRRGAVAYRAVLSPKFDFPITECHVTPITTKV